MSAWIRMIPLEQAQGALVSAYEKVKTPHGTVDNVMKAHSLRPHTMEGHVTLYRSVLHSPDNTLPFGFLEVVASYVSMLNRCDYSLTHHWANARRLMADPVRADAVHQALQERQPHKAFSGKELALLVYAGKLTTDVAHMVKADIDALHAVGAWPPALGLGDGGWDATFLGGCAVPLLVHPSDALLHAMLPVGGVMILRDGLVSPRRT